MTEVVPLPEHLLTCGCPRAKGGTHLTSCAPARAHEANPDRYKGHPDGTRFQAISWEYPLRITAHIRYDLNIDPVAYIALHRADYDAYEMEAGFEDWEKPMCFIASQIEDDLGCLGSSFGYPRHVSWWDADIDDISEHPRWVAEDTARLVAELTPGPGARG